VTKALSSTPVAMEMQVHANMLIAYLFARFGETGDGLESEASTYSLPPPEFPVSSLAAGEAPSYTPSAGAGAGVGGGLGDSKRSSGGFREGEDELGEGGRDYFDRDDGDGSSEGSHSPPSSGERYESRDNYNSSGGYNYNGAMEYNNNNNNNSNAQTLDTSRRQSPNPKSSSNSKPNYMGGTSANKSKRFSTVSPKGRAPGGAGAGVRGLGSPGERAGGGRVQKGNIII
jgi:hypothetical protein